MIPRTFNCLERPEPGPPFMFKKKLVMCMKISGAFHTPSRSHGLRKRQPERGTVLTCLFTSFTTHISCCLGLQKLCYFHEVHNNEGFHVSLLILTHVQMRRFHLTHNWKKSRHNAAFADAPSESRPDHSSWVMGPITASSANKKHVDDHTTYKPCKLEGLSVMNQNPGHERDSS